MLRVNGVEIEDTFAEAFKMRAARAIVTAETAGWARTAATLATGYATSVIGCDAEAGLEADVPPGETPDGRPGVSFLVFGVNAAALGKALVNRIGQCVMTCPTTACFDGLGPGEEAVKVGGMLRFFGDGHQASKKLDGRRYWRVPVMDGEKVVGILTESDLFRALCGMLGIGEKGARVQMTVRDDADLLQNIRGRLNGLAVRSLVTVHDPRRNAWDVVMRVRGRAAKVS